MKSKTNSRKSAPSKYAKRKGSSAPCRGSASESEMLDFVGLCVQQINTIESKRGFMVELVWYPVEDDMRITNRTAKTEIEAFRKCVQSAMQRMPNEKAQ